MKNQALVSVLLSTSLAACLPQEISEKGNHKKIEYEIAGLRPGRDSIDKAYRRFHKDSMLHDSPANTALWWNPCTQQLLTVVFDTSGIISEVRIGPAPQGNIIFDCTSRSYSRSARARMGGTGRGLLFRDSCSRVRQVYGAPELQGGPLSAKDHNLFVYRFDRGVKESLLTLKITCDSVRNEVETIRLAASNTRKP